MPYSTVDDVLDAVGFNSQVIQDLSGKTEAQVTALIEKFISQSDGKIKRLLRLPISIRKEYHKFEYDKILELGPYEDEELGFYSSYDPLGHVESVYAIYQSGVRVKLPYPRDCDLTESKDDFYYSNCVLEDEMADSKCGAIAIKAVFSGTTGYFGYPSNKNLMKNINPWLYIGFWFKTSNENATFTLSLIDKDGNAATHTFKLDFADTWEVVRLSISEFTGIDNVNKTEICDIRLSCDTDGVTTYLDNFNFNYGYFWTYPEGLIIWSDPNSIPSAEIEVTYSYDPYSQLIDVLKASNPELNGASAKYAGVLLIDFLIGCRQRITGFQQMSDTLDPRPDRETLAITRARLQREAEECLASIGYGIYEGMG